MVDRQKQQDILVHFLDCTMYGARTGNNAAWLCRCGYDRPLVGYSDELNSPRDYSRVICPKCGRVFRVVAPGRKKIPTHIQEITDVIAIETTQTKHALGMVKRNLDLKGAKGPKLELDFLRLVYVVKALRKSGHEAKGYLLVMTPSIARRVDVWQKKYEAGNSVLLETAQLSQEQYQIIKSEIRENKNGMVAGTVGEDVAGRSDATVGGQIGEVLLQQLVETHEQGVHRSFNEQDFPFRIRWDYYGTRGMA